MPKALVEIQGLFIVINVSRTNLVGGYVKEFESKFSTYSAYAILIVYNLYPVMGKDC
jgi:hypothetical protein